MLKIKNKAFTLIELLVVVAIIGILSSVVLASLSGARESARDAQRKQDIRQIQTALEMYINDNGQAPTGDEHTNNWYRSYASEWDNLESDLSEYINPLPVDPMNDYPLSYYYRTIGSVSSNECSYDSADNSYILMFALENKSDEYQYYANTGDGQYRYCVIQ